MDIIELNHKLLEARNEIPDTKTRLRTAAIDDANKLLKSGWDSTSQVLGIPTTKLNVGYLWI